MHATFFSRRVVLLVCVALLGGGAVHAQTPAPAPSPTPALSERTVYTPYEELEQVFQKEDRGVFLPYREFLDLWNKLNLPADLKKGNVPPVDGVLASARYTGHVEGDAAVFDAQLQLEALKEGWSKIPLGAADLNIAEVKPGAAGGAVPTLHLADGGYEAIVPAKGSYGLPLTVLGKVVRDAGQSTLHLRLPRTAASQFELTIPETGLDFVLTPASAFTTKEENGATRLAAFFGTTQEVAVSWRKRAAETTLPPLVFVETTLGTSVTPGVLRTTATLDFRILRAGVSQFRLLFPANQQVLTVEGTDLRDWNQDGNGPTIPEGRQRILVNLATPARDKYRLRVTLEAAVPGLPAKLSVPGVEVEGAEGQSGTITLAADPSLTVTVDPRQGVTQQGSASPTGAEEASEKPAAEAVPAGTFLGAYRFLRLPYAVDLAAQAAEPVVEVEAATLYTVTPDLLEAYTVFDYSVKKAGIFSAQIDVPAGLAHLVAAGDAVESYAVVPTPPGTAPGTQRLEVRFKERQMDKFSFAVTADAPRSRPDEPLTAALPRPVGVARVEGSLAVAVNTSLDPNTTSPGNLRQTDVGDIVVPPSRDRAKNPVTLGFRYRGDAPKPPTVAFTQRKPRVTAEVRSRVALHESLVAYHWAVAYKIEYAGTDEFVIDAPPEVADDLQFDGPNIKEKAREEEKDAAGKPTGRRPWHVRLQQKQTDGYVLEISVERPLPALSAGKTASVPWPELKTVGIFHETGTVAVVKDGNLEITHATPTGLELIDPKELGGDHAAAPSRGGSAGPEEVFLAYRYAAHPAALTLEFSKNEFLPVPTALVTYAVINTVLTTDEAETTEAIYWVRNNGRQFLSVLLPERGQMLSDVFVNGVGQQPSRRPDKNALLVRLPARVAGTGAAESDNPANDAPVSVRLVYSVPSAEPGRGGLHARGHLHFTPPTLEDTRVLQTEVSLYLPSGYRYVRFDGAMREVYNAPGWTRWREGLDPLVPSLGPDAVQEPTASWQTPPTLPTTTGSGFDSVVPKEGTPVVLRRLDAPAPVEISYRSLGYANTVEALAFFLTLLGGLALLGSSRGARLLYFFVVGVGAMIVAGAVAPRAAGAWTALYLGVLTAALVWLLSWPVGFVRRLSHRVREGRRRLRVWAGEQMRRRPPGGGGSGGGNPPPPPSPEPPDEPNLTPAA